jgi:glycosyltransferase involved in cell wall biosynthesis
VTVRILVAHNVSRTRSGGMSRIMGFIHDEIAAAGHSIEWLCAEDVPDALRGSRGRFGFPWLVWRTAREAVRKRQPFDIINVHEPQGALVALDQRRVSRYGVVVTSHGLEQRAWELALEERRAGRSGPNLKTRLVYPATSLWQSRIALKRARLVLALNEQDRAYLATRLGVPPSRTCRMRPGASEIYSARSSGRRYDSGRRLVFAGTWRKNKGIEDLIPAFTTLAQRHPGISLTVLGSGVPDSQVTNAFPADIRAQIHPIEKADDEIAARTLAFSDVFVLPSLFEGTPLTLIEGMMSGLPVVTTDTCGMRDTIVHEVTGLLVRTHAPDQLVSAIERLIGDADLRSRLGGAARDEALARHTWPFVAREVLDAYLQLVEPGPCESRSGLRTLDQPT